MLPRAYPHRAIKFLVDYFRQDTPSLLSRIRYRFEKLRNSDRALKNIECWLKQPVCKDNPNFIGHLESFIRIGDESNPLYMFRGWLVPIESSIEDMCLAKETNNGACVIHGLPRSDVQREFPFDFDSMLCGFIGFSEDGIIANELKFNVLLRNGNKKTVSFQSKQIETVFHLPWQKDTFAPQQYEEIPFTDLSDKTIPVHLILVSRLDDQTLQYLNNSVPKGQRAVLFCCGKSNFNENVSDVFTVYPLSGTKYLNTFLSEYLPFSKQVTVLNQQTVDILKSQPLAWLPFDGVQELHVEPFRYGSKSVS